MIRFIRGATVVLLFIIFGLGALFIRYFIFPFQKTKSENYLTLQKSWKFFVWLIEKTKTIKLNVIDEDKIKNIKNSIIVSNHPSFIDIVILMSIIPNSTCFVAEKLARNPFFKGMVKLLFIIEGTSIDIWVQDAVEKLNQGMNIIIFPTGTRHRKNEHLKLRKGASLIALKSKKDIVVLDIETSFDFLYTHQPIYDAGIEPVKYDIRLKKVIDTKKFIEQYEDEIDCKREITKKITKIMYI